MQPRGLISRFALLPLLIIFAVSGIAQSVNFKDTWIDKSPHKSGFITVNGVRLHYLDWGGQGATILFLPGLGNSAHIFDDIAPKFTDRFRVLGLTRRGQGRSDKPDSGYETDTRVEDILQFLDALNIKRAILVGHSLAGDEMTRFAELHPERVDKLVYLDAAYARAGAAKLLSQAPPLPQPPTEALTSLESIRSWNMKNIRPWTQAWEAELRETSKFSSDGKYLGEEMPDRVGQALRNSAEAFHPDYTKVKAPALSFYALPDVEAWVRRYTDTASQQKMRDFLERLELPHQRSNIEQFRREMRNGQIVVLENTDHYLFIQKQDVVVQKMRAFLL